MMSNERPMMSNEQVEAATPEGNIDRLLALLEHWRAHPFEGEAESFAEVERTLREDPVRFRELDLSDWHDEAGEEEP